MTARASREDAFDVLSNLNTHLEWAGEEAPKKSFRLLTMDAPAASATTGTRFSSTGANGKDTFHDRSVVVEAERGSRFGFDTESTLERNHGKTWHCRFAHRYTIEQTEDGALIEYTCEVRPQNYVPYWLRPWFRPMTRVMGGPCDGQTPAEPGSHGRGCSCTN